MVLPLETMSKFIYKNVENKSPKICKKNTVNTSKNSKHVGFLWGLYIYIIYGACYYIHVPRSKDGLLYVSIVGYGHPLR